MAIIKPTLNLVASEYTPEIINMTRASGATRVNAAGLVERVSAGTLRYDYDPTTLAGKGWLIEEARTNYIRESERFDTTWAQNGAIAVTANNTTSPDGNTTADKITSSAVGGNMGAGEGMSVASAQWVQTCFVKADTSNVARFRLNSNLGHNSEVAINLTTGATSTTNGSNISSSTSVAYPNGWFRIIVVYSVVAGTTTSLSPIIYPDDASTAGSVFVWGHSVELGSFATSYIPTTTAAVTRSQDQMEVPLSDTFFNDGASGTAMFFGQITDVSEMSNNAPWSIDDGGTPVNKISAYGSTLVVQLMISSVMQYNTPSPGTLLDETPYKHSITWETDGFNNCLNGVMGTEDTSGEVPYNLVEIKFGHSPGHTAMRSQHIKQFCLWPVRMSNADMQTITTG